MRPGDGHCGWKESCLSWDLGPTTPARQHLCQLCLWGMFASFIRALAGARQGPGECPVPLRPRAPCASGEGRLHTVPQPDCRPRRTHQQAPGGGRGEALLCRWAALLLLSNRPSAVSPAPCPGPGPWDRCERLTYLGESGTDGSANPLWLCWNLRNAKHQILDLSPYPFCGL